VNYYEHHIGDYAAATSHLSLIEDAVYTRMLRRYYLQEGPLASDWRQVARLVGARSQEELDAVEAVLVEFFVLQEDGWHQKRADADIARYLEKQSKARASAEARWGAKATECDGNANAMRPHSDSNAHQTPDTKHQSTAKDQKPKHARSASHSALIVGSPAAISIPLNTGDDYPVTEAQCREFADLYPAVDVPQQLRSIRAWAITNPAKRKTKAGILRFVNAWLARAQDQGGASMQPRAGPPAAQSKTLTAIQNLQGMKNELAENRTADRLPEAALPGPRSHPGN
jgi:uncharacterized protein YdaU (DUF1376 family)